MNNIPRRAYRSYRLGKLITLILVLVAGAAGASQINRPSPPTQEPPNPTTEPTLYAMPPSPVPSDTVTINLTWEEYADLVQCIYATTTYISLTTSLGPDYIQPDTLKYARATRHRLNTLADTLFLEAQASVPHPPEQASELFLNRSDSFSNMWMDLWAALLNAVTAPNDPITE